VAVNEILWIVREALGRLDASQNRVLELRFVRDLSYREIGDALGITSNNAGVRINRALARLKMALPHLIDGTVCLALSAPEARV
jgi:RNA polymerase sigma factor (sigma-70 family)